MSLKACLYDVFNFSQFAMQILFLKLELVTLGLAIKNQLQ